MTRETTPQAEAPSASLKSTIATSVRPVATLAPQLSAAGWQVGIVSGATSKREALAAIGRALAFPAHYGRNLDALHDCLAELTGPTALVWAGWEPLAVHAPDEWTALREVLDERVADAGLPPFAAVFCVAQPE